MVRYGSGHASDIDRGPDLDLDLDLDYDFAKKASASAPSAYEGHDSFSRSAFLELSGEGAAPTRTAPRRESAGGGVRPAVRDDRGAALYLDSDRSAPPRGRQYASPETRPAPKRPARETRERGGRDRRSETPKRSKPPREDRRPRGERQAPRAPRGREPRRRSAGPWIVFFLLMLAVAAAAIALLILQLRNAESRAGELTQALQTSQAELRRYELDEPTAAPTPDPTPAPTAIPAADTPAPAEDTPAPAQTAEPTPVPTAEPTAKPVSPLAASVTDEMLGKVARPMDESWLDEPLIGVVSVDYMLAVHWGPSMNWLENMALYRNDKVVLLALEDGWYLLRSDFGRYGWAAEKLIRVEGPAETTPAPVPTAPESPVYAPAEASGPDLG